jgi:hypothetical protein
MKMNIRHQPSIIVLHDGTVHIITPEFGHKYCTCTAGLGARLYGTETREPVIYIILIASNLMYHTVTLFIYLTTSI